MINIYIGSEPEQWLASKVLQFSIVKNTDSEVSFLNLYESKIKVPKTVNPKAKPYTPFSFHRFLIPQLQKYEGKAIYLDSDMLVFDNIEGLNNRNISGVEILSVKEPTEISGRKSQFSVMLLNCDLLKWDIIKILHQLDTEEFSYSELMQEMVISNKIEQSISNEWNSLEYFDDKKTKLLHFTDMWKQPWISKENELGYIWVKYLIEACSDGFIKRNDLLYSFFKGNIRPSLLFQIKLKVLDSTKLPSVISKLDRFFVPPPYKKGRWQEKVKYIFNVLSFLIIIILTNIYFLFKKND